MCPHKTPNQNLHSTLIKYKVRFYTVLIPFLTYIYIPL